MRAGGMLLCALLALASCGAVSSFIATPLNGAPVRATGRAPALSLRMADPHVARRDVPALFGRALLTGIRASYFLKAWVIALHLIIPCVSSSEQQ